MKHLSICALVVGLGLSASTLRADEDAKKIVAKAIKAHGGEKVLTKFQANTSEVKGDFFGMGAGIPYTGKFAAQLPDKMKFSIAVDAGGVTFETTTLVVGDKGWAWSSVQKEPMALTKDALVETKHQMYIAKVESLVPLLKDKAFTLSVVGDDKVGKKKVVGILVKSKGKRDINLYFDKESGQLAKRSSSIKDAQAGGQEMTEDVVYEEYKKAQGYVYPSKITIMRDGKKYVTAETTDFVPTEKLDKSVFAKPAS